ncbi:MAG: CDP-alcohol phosphatidyltransferase family protein [Candidatus Poseidoniaceae archaeon]|jgi:phosphatidylserine synthase|nr:CDP-alcohol phosphatidyltransferase family protein [Candidatus Poseidoniaceae archaeon]MDP7001657.1 CDP-alcohol phosphatidyltransferase family protein [Candidatus Poseidoniaceae archaeon]
MKTTYRMMGLADYITLGNGLLGAGAIFFLVLAVGDLHQPYQDGIKSQYIWAAQLCIILSMIGDIIDGPVARRYSKRQLLGGSLDIMSDSVSFGIAPALLIFVLYGRMGEATPLWTIMLATACCWVIVTAMLRLARFDYDDGSDYPWFNGLSSPGNAVLLLSLSSLIWLQPSTGVGPGLSTWDCELCFGQGVEKPWFDFLIIPGMIISGGLMISDRKLSKLKHGKPMLLSVVALLSLLIGTIIQLRYTLGDFPELDEAAGISTIVLFSTCLILCLGYIIFGPTFVAQEYPNYEQE